MVSLGLVGPRVALALLHYAQVPFEEDLQSHLGGLHPPSDVTSQHYWCEYSQQTS